MQSFQRLQHLPPYVFTIVNEFKQQAMAQGREIIDLGMGNPDQPTPKHIVDALIASANQTHTHRYATPYGIDALREALCAWYQRNYQVKLQPFAETIVTIGSKDGLGHLALATTGPGDVVIAPNPTYPIHSYGFIIAGAEVHSIALHSPAQFLQDLQALLASQTIKPKMLVLNFPSNPTGFCVDLAFYTEIVALAHQYQFWVVNDLAYADLYFSPQPPPSILQVSGAKDIAVEAYSLSKSYNMAGWRVGFMSGNATLIAALRQIKSYLDYGMFEPIQIAAVAALQSPPECLDSIRAMYRERRDALCEGLRQVGWNVAVPEATMFVWAKIPAKFQHMKSLEFIKYIMDNCNVALSPGVAFGAHGDDHVRFSLVTEPAILKQAVKQIAEIF